MMALVDMRPQGLTTVSITRSHSCSRNHNTYYERNSSATRVSPIFCRVKDEEEGGGGGERRISSSPSSPSSEKKRFKLADRESTNSQTMPFELPKISIGGGATLLGLASDISRLLLLPRQALGFDISTLKRKLIDRKPTRKQRGGGDEKMPLASNILEGLSPKPPSSPGPRCNWPRGTLDPIGASDPTRASTPTRASAPTSVSDPIGVSSPHCNWPRKTLNPIGVTASALVSSPARDSASTRASDPTGVSSPHCNWPRKTLNPIGASTSTRVSSGYSIAVVDASPITEILPSGPHCPWPRRSISPISEPEKAPEPKLVVSEMVAIQGGARCAWPRASVPAATRDSVVAMESTPSDSSSCSFNGNYSSTEVSPSSLPRRMLATGVGLGLINRLLLLQGGGGFTLASPLDLFDIGIITSDLSDRPVDKEEAETESALGSTKSDLAGIDHKSF